MSRLQTSVLLVLTLALSLSLPLRAAPDMDPALREKARRSIDAGLRYLKGSQREDGSWAESVGITALALRAFLESHRGYDESDGPFMSRPVGFLIAHVNEDGSISETNQNRAYNTAVSLTALSVTNNPDYEAVIRGGQDYLKKLQLGAAQGYDPDHRYYGGIGYGGDLRPDLSNQYMAMEALRATALDPEDPTWERALAFINRSQNFAKTNDQEWAGSDGGFTYMPGYSPHGGTGSYGSMTYAGLLSLLFAGVDKEDPRVQAAWDWILVNYTLEDNPGAKDRSGLFYYYNAFAKSMYAMGVVEVKDAKGQQHNWRNELAEKLLSLQKEDGSWENPWSQRWWEGKADLVTAWSVIALNYVVREPN